MTSESPEANGGVSAETIAGRLAALNGTPPDPTTVPGPSGSPEGGEGGETPPSTEEDTPKYSEKTFQAAREAAVEEGKSTALKDYQDRQKQRKQRLAQAVTDNGLNAAPVIRSVQQELKKLSEDLTDEEMEPTLRIVRQVRDTMEDAAFVIVAQSWRDALDGLLGNDSKDFWEKAYDLDPALDVDKILPLFSETYALRTDAVKKADPQSLIDANPALKAHIAKLGDDRYDEGRKQGRKDPPAQPSSNGRASPADNGQPIRDKDGRIDVAANLARINSGG